MTTSISSFVYNANPGRVVFGSGSVRKLGAELSRLEKRRPLVICSPAQEYQAKDVIKTLKDAEPGLFSQATMHTPIAVTNEALEMLRTQGSDSIVSLGGGSAIGLGKALSIRSGLPHVCIPTTYAGSEMTPILGETENERKVTRSDPKILPGTVIYDVDLTLTLPVGLTAYSGVNAIAHSVEALYAQNTNPVIDLLALEGIRALASSLPLIVQSPSDVSKRTDAQYGAWLCGIALGSVGMALHHKLCHTLGGSFNMPHAETHTVILPHALSYNAPAIPEVMRRLADALPDSNGDAIHGLNVLLGRIEVKRDLKSFGLRDEDVAKAAEIACSSATYPNPRPLEKSRIQELVRRAWAGGDARADL